MVVDHGHHPYRLSCGRITIRYGNLNAAPQILWDNTGLISALNLPTRLEELVPQACEALWMLFQEDVDAGYRAADRFFEDFTPSWNSYLSQERTPHAIRHWLQVLSLVRDWENRSDKSVHKGTPYYFLGATYIFARDFDLGLRYLYDAIEEDKRSGTLAGHPDSYRRAPAYKLASLVDDPNNFLYRGVVLPARTRIDAFLTEYRAKTNSSIQLADFERKFLSEPTLEFQKLYFVYTLLEMIKLESAWNPLGTPNDFSKMRNRDVLLDLCLIIDEVLRHNYPPATFISHGVYNLSRSRGWLNSEDSDHFSLNRHLNPKVSGKKAPKPEVVVPALLDLSLTYRGAPVSLEMSWLLLAWHLRNYAAHDLSPQQVLVHRYRQIAQALMNALFMSLEVKK